MNLNIALDLVLIAIIFLGLRYGYNKGLFKMTAGPAKRILCLLLSFSYSSIIGSRVIVPVLICIVEKDYLDIPNIVITPLSSVIAFFLLFSIIKILLSFLISFIDSILNKGVLEILNRGLGIALAGLISFGLTVCLSSLLRYLLSEGFFDGSSFFDNFYGGPIYRLLIKVNPIRYLPLP